MSTVPARFVAALDRLGIRDGPVVVAVSGGPDSVALLDLVDRERERRGLAVTVAHFDHGIQTVSSAVAAAVEALAASRGLAFRLGRGALGPDASETRARAARRAWLAAVARAENGPVLTGHHLDDQLETLLMRFIQGSGPLGLAGIAEGQGIWGRPLLGVSRAELAGYLSERGLSAWTDPTNADPRHLRSWLRTEILPRLESRLPRLPEQLLAGRAAARENRSAWDSLLDSLPGLDFRLEGDGASVAAGMLAGYSSPLVRTLLRSLGRRIEVTVGRGQLDRLQTLLRQGHTGQSVDLVEGARAELAFGRLRLFRTLAHPVEYDAPVPVAPGRLECGPWSLATTLETEAPAEIDRSAYRTWIAAADGLRVRPWRVGDRIRPMGGRGSRLVVRCMQDRKVPRSNRPGWPVVVVEGEVIWVPGVCRSAALLPDPGTRAVRIDASRS